jgi:hypothetical protein
LTSITKNPKSSENNLKEFDHPEYGILNPSQVRELRGELTRHVIDSIGSLSNYLREKKTLDTKDRTTRFHFIRVCTIIKDLNEIDPEWYLRYLAPDDECIKIKLHDCKCCYHNCQKPDKIIQFPESSSNKSSQTEGKESTQE